MKSKLSIEIVFSLIVIIFFAAIPKIYSGSQIYACYTNEDCSPEANCQGGDLAADHEGQCDIAGTECGGVGNTCPEGYQCVHGDCVSDGGGGGGGGAVCGGCWPLEGYGGLGHVTSTSIQKTSATSAVINWTYQAQQCLNKGKFVLYLGTDRNAIGGNCGGANQDHNYRGTESVLPLGCLASRDIGIGSRSFDTAAGSNPINLAPHTVYYVKVVSWVANCIGQGAAEECFSNACSAPSSKSFLGTCNLNPTSWSANVGDSQTFTTNDTYQSENVYLASNVVATSVVHKNGKCTGSGENEECSAGFITIRGSNFEAGDNPNVRIVQNGVTVYQGQPGPISDPLTLTISDDSLNTGSPGSIVASDVTMSFTPAALPPNNVNNVSYTGNSSYISIGTPIAYTSPYSTLVTALASTYTSYINLTSSVYATGVSSAPACTASAPIAIAEQGTSSPWWQVKDSDIQANDTLTSFVPGSLYFDLEGDGGYPGVVAYTNSTNLTASNVSPTGWLANSSNVGTRIFNYDYFANQIPADTTINTIDQFNQGVVDGGTVDSATGYYWFKYDGSQHGGAALTASGNITIGSKKIIVLVENADLGIGDPINGITRGQGFFMVITNGNIDVNSYIGGGASPTLEGLYVSDGYFSDNTLGTLNPPSDDLQFRLRGSVVAYGGVRLLRDLGGAANTTTPAEFFEYAPDQILLFPSKLGVRKINWKEVAP